jgi:hypothetical protein
MTVDSVNFGLSVSDPGPGTTRCRNHSLSVNHLYEPAFGQKYAHLRKGSASKVLGNWDTYGVWIANTHDRFVSYFSGGGARGAPFSAQRNYWFTTSRFVATLTIALKGVF